MGSGHSLKSPCFILSVGTLKMGLFTPPLKRYPSKFAKKNVLFLLVHSPGSFAGPPSDHPKSCSRSLGLLLAPKGRAFKAVFRWNQYALP